MAFCAATTAAAQAKAGPGGKAGSKGKAAPARAVTMSAAEAQQGIAAAMQGLEGAASAPKGAVAPPATPGALNPVAAWPFPKKPERTPAQAAAAAADKAAKDEAAADPLFAKARETARMSTCGSNMRQLATGVLASMMLRRLSRTSDELAEREAEAIVDARVEGFMQWLAARKTAPLVKRLAAMPKLARQSFAAAQ